MRRWVCVIALLAGFSGGGYAWTTRYRQPVPIVRQVDPGAGEGGLARTLRWWLA